MTLLSAFPSIKQRGVLVLLLAFLLSIALAACNMDHRTLPRNMKLKAFDPHRPDYTCVMEADVVPAPSAEAEALFQQGLAATTYGLREAQRDYAKAAQLWEQAAAQGHWKAALNLAGLYEQGMGVHEDTERAVQIVEQLMNQGVPSAFDKMGSYHARGIGVNLDINRAYAFWQLAADKGSATAQAYIGNKLNAVYDKPPSWWGNKPVGLAMLKCSYAQDNKEAAYDLGVSLNVSMEDYQGALQVLHNGVKFGSSDCASYLSASFDDIEPLTGNTVDKDRSDRYYTLGDALRGNPDLRFPNLDKVLPLPPAKLPQWDGEMDSLVNAAKGVIPVPPPKPTAGAERTGRAHIPNGYGLAEVAEPQPPTDELARVVPEKVGQRVSVAEQPEGATVPFSGYWLPQLAQAAHDWMREWNARQVPQRHALGEPFEPVDRRGMGEYARVVTVKWHYRGEAVPLPEEAAPPFVVQGVARLSAQPQPPLACVGALPCPRPGIWQASVADAHPSAKRFNRWDRQTYLRKGQAFPDLSGGDPKVGQEQVVWHWLANANDVNFADVEQITLTPAPRRT